uniref:Uncharacterized protein n=2 Tax=Schistocephalus solidus TaxID=70667 RepID=A0A0X3NQG1_SCHSO
MYKSRSQCPCGQPEASYSSIACVYLRRLPGICPKAEFGGQRLPGNGMIRCTTIYTSWLTDKTPFCGCRPLPEGVHKKSPVGNAAAAFVPQLLLGWLCGHDSFFGSPLYTVFTVMCKSFVTPSEVIRKHSTFSTTPSEFVRKTVIDWFHGARHRYGVRSRRRDSTNPGIQDFLVLPASEDTVHTVILCTAFFTSA